MNQFFNFLLVFAVLIVGFDFLAQAFGPRAHAGYRRMLGRAVRFIRQQVNTFVRWSWRNYRQAIIGFALGVILTLYFTGRPQ